MNSQDGRGMDRQPPLGSIQRARERAAAGLPRDDGLLSRGGQGRLEEEQPRMPRAPLGSTAGQRGPLRPQPPPGLQTRDGQIGVAISRPTQVPQWPLPASIMPQTDIDGEPYRPPPGRLEPPQRPPRPSRVPSILDGTKVQDFTPVFQYRPRSERDSSGPDTLGIPETPTSMSRSSVGTIPDFPVPVNIPSGPPRRSVNLGPPPSARRGASSFYSHLSYVSPIPEESPRSRSHTSFASSAAMPESWGTPSPGQSPQYPEAYYDDTIMEEGSYDGNDDEARLVRDASVGQLAKPMLVSAVTARTLGLPQEQGMRPGPSPIQTGPFPDGTGYVDHSSSSSTVPVAARLPMASAVNSNSVVEAASLNSSEVPSTLSGETGSDNSAPSGGRPYSRLSAIRRPPRLDMDAVRQAEARGSLTSLPDLIKRATRLAASLEKGKRPASRFDDSGEYAAYDFGAIREKHQSGLSDMLAAFPPPAQPVASSRRSIRESIRDHVQSWPLAVNLTRTGNTSRDAVQNSNSSDSQRSPTNQKQGRRCCGLPLWGFLVVLLLFVILATAAIVIPVEFLVIQKQKSNNDAQAALQQCQQQLPCANGGTTVVNEGACGCLCTNGFTGYDCNTAPAPACATMSLGNSMENVTVGDAIPRLIEQAQTNFSIPLDGTEVVAKINAGNLSCAAANALVTFDGSAVREGSGKALAFNANAVVIEGIAFTTITLLMGQSTTITVDAKNPWPTSVVVSPSAGTTVRTTVVAPTTVATTFIVSSKTTQPAQSTITTTPTVTSTITTTMSVSSGVAIPPKPTFSVTQEVLDFARVAVLYILQVNQLSDAEKAQSALQRFFTNAAGTQGQTVESARNITVGGGKSVDLVDFTVDAGGKRGVVGGTAS
ncbi:hypothetical protein QBC38DRAFT_518483 [Podospora fimiseda]|uniref:EGF-like domain-containing protein n=1 Tax=Podospora fimiseda TaxID=252190 RepID=A0AAN7BUT5_9PEZI|nr:hypothetical protein QBC38DRAFT_518483 [Podospora fimiseda]